MATSEREKSDDIYPGKAVKGPDGRTVGVVASVDANGFTVVGLSGRRQMFTWDQVLAKQAEMRGGVAPELEEPREEVRAELGTQGGVVAVAYKIDPDGTRRLDRIVGDGRDDREDQKYLPCPNPGVCNGAQHLARLVGGEWWIDCPYGRRAWTPETLAKNAVHPESRPDVTLSAPGGPPAPPGAKTTGWTGRR